MDKFSTSDSSDSYLPALDGFRAISILLVILSHAGLGDLVPGGLGVLVFYVISGFLITRQMILEIERTGILSLKKFYFRRLLRLAPALFVYITLSSLLLSALGSEIRPIHIVSGLFYFANYYHIFVGYTMYNPISIIWSLAVEEHYYILFPFIVLLFRHKLPALIPWLFAIVAAVCCWRFYLVTHCATDPAFAACGLPDSNRIYKGTDTIFDCILYGSITALLLQYYSEAMKKLAVNRLVLVAALAALLFTLLYRNPLWRDTLRFSIQSIAIALIIINVLFDEKNSLIRKLLGQKLLVYVGRLSYSLYLFHYGVLCVLEILQSPTYSIYTPSGIIIYLTATFLSASLCYEVIEKPMLALRKRFGSHQTA